MFRVRSILSLLAAACVVAAQDPHSLAGLVPARTPLYLEAKNPPREELERLATWKILKEPGLRKLFEQLSASEGIAAKDVALGSAGVTMHYDFRELAMRIKYIDRRGERSFGIKDQFALAWIGLAEGPIPIDAVVSFRVAGEAQAAVDTIKRIIAAAIQSARRPGGASRGEWTIDAVERRFFFDLRHRDTSFTRLTTKGGAKVFLGAVGEMFIATTTEARMRDIIDRQADGRKDSLAESPRYKAILAHARGTGSPTTVLAVQIDRALDAVAQAMPMQVQWIRAFLKSQGLDSARTLASVSRVDGDGITNTVSLLLDPQRKSTSPFFAPGRKAKHSGLGFVPENALYFSSMVIDFGKFYRAFGNPGIDSGFREMTGLRLQEDILDLIDGELVFVVAQTGGLIPDVGLVLESADAGRLAGSLRRLAGLLDWPPMTGVRKVTRNGVEAHVVPLGHPRLLDLPVALTFGVVDNKLLIAASPLAFGRFVAVQRGQRPGIRSNRDFAKLRERVPADAEGLSYLDLPRLTELLYDTLIPILQGFPQPEASTGIYELPDSSAFTRHLYGRIAWTTTDKRGLHWVSHSPVDGNGAMIGGVAFGSVAAALLAAGEPAQSVAVGHPVRGRSRDQEAMNCEANVQVLKHRLRYYRREHKRLPKTLDLLRARFVPAGTFIVPGTDKPYVYLGPNGVGMVLLHGLPNGEDRKICVLTRRMKVVRVSEQRLKKMLEPQPERSGR